MDIEIAPGKRARQAYSFDDIAIVPSRRTRDPEEVSTTWQIDAYKFDLPMLAAPMTLSFLLKQRLRLVA
jgi:IMP dehydrogenase